jgi:beta-glucosidase
MVGWFSEYTQLCANKFGDRIHHWLILNEPMAFTSLGYFIGMHAPGRIGINSYLASIHHATLCQAEGGRILRENVTNAHIGTALSCAYIEPHKAKPRFQRAAKRLDVMINRLFIEPALGMGYPVNDLPFLQKLDKFIKPGDEQKLKFDFDFIGLQNYYKIVTKPGIVPFVWASQVKPGKNAELTEMGWEVAPEGIYKILKQYAKYPLKEIIITENGAAFPDTIVNGHVHDNQRINFIKAYLKNILKAKNEGVNITGYFVWTFIDNFEWKDGFRPRFGIVYNNFISQERIVKDSGLWFKEFLK